MSSSPAPPKSVKERREKLSTSTAAENLTKSDINILSSRGYCLAQVVGEGSYAKVYQCRKTEGSNTVYLACKVIDSQKAPTNFVKKFLTREIDILTKIQHPHIIHLFSMLHKSSRYFIFMRLAEKGDLLEFILKKNHIGEGRARTWATQLALALEYLHTMGIVHRDIKTENILITAAYNAKLSDFGFARNIYENGLEVLCQTHCGSMPYTAPEVLRGKKYDARKSDMWSLGVVTYVMLNKRLPFNGTNSQEAMIQKQLDRKVHFENKDASSQYRAAVMTLLEPDVSKRFSASAFLGSAWIHMDERLIGRTKHENDAYEKSLAHREKMIKASSGSAGPSNLPTSLTIRDSIVATSTNLTNDHIAVIRQEQPSSYSSVMRDAVPPAQEHETAHGSRGLSLGRRKETALTSKAAGPTSSNNRHAK